MALAMEESRIFLPETTGHCKEKPHPKCSTISRRILPGIGKEGEPNILSYLAMAKELICTPVSAVWTYCICPFQHISNVIPHFRNM
jgi:hypothetical protein